MSVEVLGSDPSVRHERPDGRRPRMRRGPGTRAIPALLAALVVACSGGAATGRPSVDRSPGPGPSVTPGPVPDKMELVVDDRPVTVHVPATGDPDRPAPLLIVLHGYGSSGREHEEYFHLGAAAAGRGVVTAYPDGTIDRNGNRFWNATDACCDFDRSAPADEAYLMSVIRAIEARRPVDPKRIAFLGHSNGGFMSHRMACTHADRIAAIVSLAGASFARAADCAPSSAVAVVQIHGTLDDIVRFTGGTLQGFGSGAPMAAYPGAERTAGSWATSDGCEPSPTVADRRVDVDAALDADGAPAEATITRWSGCDPGGAVELWTMPRGSHDPAISAAFPDAVLDFLEAHPKP